MRAIELGMRVVLFEKEDCEWYPCNSRMSGGCIHVCLLDVRREPEELYDATMVKTGSEVNKAQARALTQNVSRYVDWLAQHGAQFMSFNMMEAMRWDMAPPRPLVAGQDWIGRGPDVVLRGLMQRFVVAGGQAMLDTRAVRLLMSDGRYVGVAAERNGREVDYNAPALLIADGGFQADRRNFVEHVGPNFEAVFQRGAATGIGDGMRMAAEAGAKTRNTQSFYGHLLAQEALTNEKL
jgi:fumarate reductase flavoprotein subunit